MKEVLIMYHNAGVNYIIVHYWLLYTWKDKWARWKEDVPSTLLQSLICFDQENPPKPEPFIFDWLLNTCNKLRSREIVFSFLKIEKLSPLQYG